MGEQRREQGEPPAGSTVPKERPPAGAYPGRLDETLITPSAPLPPGAWVRVVPTALAPAPDGSVPAGWAPDPSGRHQWRWWGGASWTEHVADDGRAGVDPVGEP